MLLKKNPPPWSEWVGGLAGWLLSQLVSHSVNAYSTSLHALGLNAFMS
jgi:hypothetical protein